MVYFPKSQPAPASLAARTTWKDEDVMQQLQADFHNKCYICEAKEITSINVEHFKPHKGDVNLMYDWNNLFFVCGHCNNTKVAKKEYDGILDCTNPAHKVTDWIRYIYDDTDFSKIKVVIEELVSQNGVKPTVKLLEAVYNGNTINKKMESGNLRKLLSRQLDEFSKHLAKFYLDDPITGAEKQSAIDNIISHLQKDSAFSAFKIWIIRSKEKYMEDFGQYIPA